MEKARVKLGLASCVQPSFWGSSRDLFRGHYLPAVQRLAGGLAVDCVAWPKDIVSEEDARQAVAFLNDEGADFVLLQCTTFPGGNVILPFGQLQGRLGLWAIAEPVRGGPIPLNSFCGVNMLASIWGQYMGEGKPLKWFYGDVDDPLFARRLRVTLGALGGIKRLDGARIGLVGGIAPGFTDFAFDERTTKKKLNVTVDRLPEFGEIKERALAYDSAQTARWVEEFAAEAVCVAAHAQKDMENTVRVYHALEDTIRENGYDAIAVGCWPKYRRDLGIVVCSIIGRLLDKGYIAACEGDVDSAASMLMLGGIANAVPMLMDLSDVDFADDTALLWHCGSAPGCYAGKGGNKINTHYKPGRHTPAADDVPVGTVNEMEFAPGPVTVARFTWAYERMLILDGNVVEKADTGFDGSRGWMGQLRMAGERVDAKTLVNTLMNAKFQHHYPLVKGSWNDELMEAAAWLGARPIRPDAYQPYLQL